MASLKLLSLTVIFVILMCTESKAKLAKNETTEVDAENDGEIKTQKRVNDGGAAMLFADELKQTLEMYLFGMCPQTFKMLTNRGKNQTMTTCELDTEQEDLAGKFATLALRAHSAARTDCTRFGAALANTLGELARTAANRHALAAANSNDNKKRKLSKSQKAKIQAKQRTALAVKKKAAAMAAAAAAKMTS